VDHVVTVGQVGFVFDLQPAFDREQFFVVIIEADELKVAPLASLAGPACRDVPEFVDDCLNPLPTSGW
jgi:hypothetical protein